MKRVLILSVIMWGLVGCSSKGYDYVVQQTVSTFQAVRMKPHAVRDLTGYAPSLSPDGTKVLFTRSDSVGDRRVVMLDLVSGDEREVTDPISYGGQWSPSGEKFLYNSFDGSDWWVALLDLKSGSTQRLGHGSSPIWSSDSLVVFQDMHQVICCNPNDTMHVRYISLATVLADSIDVSSASTFLLLDNGRQLIFYADDLRYQGLEGLPLGTLFRWTLPNQLQRITTPDTDVMNFSVWNQRIYYTGFERDSLLLFSVGYDGGAPRRFMPGMSVSFSRQGAKNIDLKK